MHVAHGRADMAVTHKVLHGRQVRAGLDQVSGERVTQAVDTARARDAGGGVARGAVDALHGVDADGRVARVVGKEPRAWPPIAPVAAQPHKQAHREQRVPQGDFLRGVPILSALALAHLDAHALRGALDVRQFQCAHLGQAQPRLGRMTAAYECSD